MCLRLCVLQFGFVFKSPTLPCSLEYEVVHAAPVRRSFTLARSSCPPIGRQTGAPDPRAPSPLPWAKSGLFSTFMRQETHLATPRPNLMRKSVAGGTPAGMNICFLSTPFFVISSNEHVWSDIMEGVYCLLAAVSCEEVVYGRFAPHVSS
jgi:hypothetical protein